MMTNLALDHACANARCTNMAKAGQLACRACWSRLPLTLRKQIWATHHDGNRAGHSERVLEARQFWAGEARI